MADVGHHNSAAWLDHFELRGIDVAQRPAHATLAPKASAGHALRFATAPRLERLGQHLTRLSGTPVRVTLAAPPTAQQRDEQRAAAVPDSPAGSRTGSAGGVVDRRDALSLPLVRDAFDVFPDAILVDARKDEPPKAIDASPNPDAPAE